MNEKVIHDIKITETEDGFHIEIKGDKEILRRWLDRAGGFFANFGGRGRGPFGWRGHEEHGFREHGPFGPHQHGQPPFGERGPFGRHEHGHPSFGGFGPFGRAPSREERDALREQMRDWKQQAREWHRQMHEWKRQMHQRGAWWGASPEDREEWVRHLQESRGQWPFGAPEKFKNEEGGEEQRHGYGPFQWRGHRQRPQRRYDLGPWWDEGEAADDLPTV